jgi:hypothetical protein
MNKPIGGRGKKAPYETTHVRIPVDLKPQVELLVEKFRDNGCVVDNEVPDRLLPNSDNFIQKMIEEFKKENLFIAQQINENPDNNVINSVNLNLEQSIELANQILLTRATKKELVNKLLTALFGIEVTV